MTIMRLKWEDTGELHAIKSHPIATQQLFQEFSELHFLKVSSHLSAALACLRLKVLTRGSHTPRRKFLFSGEDGKDSLAPIRTRNKDEIVRGANIITGPNGQATAAEDYKEHCRHELTFQIGDKVNVLHYTEDPKWAMARNTSGRRGLIPVSHFERAPSSAQDSMQVYFGTMTRQKAEELIRTNPYTDGKFLIRENGIYEGEVTLSLGFSDRQSGAQKFAHYRIAKEETGMVYVCEDKRFTSVRQLIDFYMNQQSGLAHKLGLWYKSNNTKVAKVFCNLTSWPEEQMRTRCITILNKGCSFFVK